LAEEARLDKPITWDSSQRVFMIDSPQPQLRKRWKNNSSDCRSGTYLLMSMPQNS